MDDITFDESQPTRRVTQPKRDLIDRFVASGIVTTRTQAQYVLLAAAVAAIVAAIFLFTTSGPSLNPDPQDVPPVAGPQA